MEERLEMSIRTLTLALLLSLTLTGAARAAPEHYAWWPTRDGHWGLFKGDDQVGWLNAEDGRYFPRLAGGGWGGACEPPVLRPEGKAVGGKPVFGVDPSRIRRDRTSINGRSVTTQEAIKALEANLPDDARHLRVTVIGPDDSRKAVLGDLQTHPSLAAWKGQLVVQEYGPEDWAVKGAGFHAGGTPTIYVQSPGGTVLHRQDGYGGPDELAAALRKLDPNYDAKKDPDRRRILPTLGLNINVPWSVYAVAGAAAVIALLGKNRWLRRKGT
jgi:hypothetical protein